MVFASDYYPFGMQMPERSFDSPKYRYGFNGKEKDEDGEWGSLTHYDYGFRIYNPGIGKFLSVDPLAIEYPFYSPYQFAGNTPIQFVDLDGLEFTNPYPEKAKEARSILEIANNDLIDFNTQYSQGKLRGQLKRQRRKLEFNVSSTETVLKSLESKSDLVDRMIKTLEIVDKDNFDRLNALTGPNGENVPIVIELLNTRKGDRGQLAEVFAKPFFIDGRDNIFIAQKEYSPHINSRFDPGALIRIYKGNFSFMSALFNEVGDLIIKMEQSQEEISKNKSNANISRYEYENDEYGSGRKSGEFEEEKEQIYKGIKEKNNLDRSNGGVDKKDVLTEPDKIKKQ